MKDFCKKILYFVEKIDHFGLIPVDNLSVVLPLSNFSIRIYRYTSFPVNCEAVVLIIWFKNK